MNELARSARHDKYHLKDIKPLPRRKLTEKVPLLDCFTAPCEGGCPIRQDIPEYMELCRTGRYTEALTLITEKIPSPSPQEPFVPTAARQSVLEITMMNPFIFGKRSSWRQKTDMTH